MRPATLAGIAVAQSGKIVLMLYVIGGAARTGKSTLAEQLVRWRAMPCMPLDAMRSSICHSAPQLGIDTKAGFPERAIAMQPFITNACKALGSHWSNAAIEGDDVLPSTVAALAQANIEIRCVFLGNSKVDTNALLADQGANGWLSRLSSDELPRIARAIQDTSDAIRDSCAAHGFAYLDVAQSTFDSTQVEALRALTD